MGDHSLVGIGAIVIIAFGIAAGADGAKPPVVYR